MKPFRSENEYIWRKELQNRTAHLERPEKEQQGDSEAEKRRLEEAHWMPCPKCGQTLSAEKCGSVEMDVCLSCKGVWLDMGDLGAIVETAGEGSVFHSSLRALLGRADTSPRLSS